MTLLGATIWYLWGLYEQVVKIYISSTIFITEHLYSKNRLYFLRSSFSNLSSGAFPPVAGGNIDLLQLLERVKLGWVLPQAGRGSGRVCRDRIPTMRAQKGPLWAPLGLKEPEKLRGSNSGLSAALQAVQSCPSVRAVPLERGQSLEQETPGEFTVWAALEERQQLGSFWKGFLFFVLYQIRESLSWFLLGRF